MGEEPSEEPYIRGSDGDGKREHILLQLYRSYLIVFIPIFRSFLLHVPIVLACALTTVLQLPKDTPTDRQSTPVNTQGQKEESPDTEKLDYIGISLLVCAIVTALMMVQVFQADEIPENKLYFTIALGSVSLLLGIAFCTYEMRWAERPLIPLSFMLSSKTGVICAVQILTMIADMSVSVT